MKIRRVTVQDGTEGRGYGADVSLDITGDAGADVAAAIEIEHSCEDSQCDIRAALEAGFPFSAAHLLWGATETPVLDAVKHAHEVNGSWPAEVNGWPPDWEAWVAHHREVGRECQACGAFNYPVDGWEADSCGDCLARLTQPGDPEDLEDIE